jgi:CysZ protein
MLLHALSLSFRQLADRETLRLLALVVSVTLVIFTMLGFGLWWLFHHYVLPGWLGVNDGLLAAAGAVVTATLMGWFLFRAVAMAVMGLFTDGVVASVEEDHYPAIAASATPVSFAAGLSMGLRSAMRAIGWNLLASPLYVLLLVTGVGTLALMLIINAKLLGRDLETMVAARHPGTAVALAPRERWFLGFVTAGLFIIPFVNIIAPVVGSALAVHLMHMDKSKA